MPALTAALRKDYESKWATCVVDYEPAKVAAVAKRVMAVKATCSGFWSVPWWFVALCWLRECNLNPKGCLHNGELIIGTGRKTKLVPAGRGPFQTWAEATRDALILQGYDRETDWTIGATGYRFEGFNGFGYRNKGVPSPYLWSHTNHYADGSWDDDPKGGKYIRDRVWDENTYDPQIGVMAVLKALQALDPSILSPAAPAPTPPAPFPPPPDIEPAPPAPPKPQTWVDILVALLRAIFSRRS